jgi:hypothetical protein
MMGSGSHVKIASLANNVKIIIVGPYNRVPKGSIALIAPKGALGLNASNHAKNGRKGFMKTEWPMFSHGRDF